MQAVSELFSEAAKRDFQSPWVEVSLFGNNLAHGKPIIASSQIAGFEGVKAVNATIEPDDAWSSQDAAGQPPEGSEWIVVDLLWQTQIDMVDLYCRVHEDVGYAYPVEIGIHTSTDNVAWTTVMTRTGTGQTPYYPDRYCFPSPVVCRYVRVFAWRTAFRVDPNGIYCMQLCEIQIMKQPVKIFDLVKGSINHVISIGEINYSLDTIGLNEWKTGNVRLEIDNSDNQWSPSNPRGLFVNQRSCGAQVNIKAGYLLDDGSRELLTVFTGYLKEPARHGDTISGTLTCYDFWERLDRVKLDDLKDPATSVWYTGKQIDFLVRKIFACAGFTRFEYAVEAATTVIPTADFSGMTAKDGIVQLAEVMNFECGMSTLGVGFFRSREVPNLVTLEVRNKKNGDKNLISISNISPGWDKVINCFTAKNHADPEVELKVETTGGRPNSTDRYGYIKQEINNKFLKQLSDVEILAVLTQYFGWYSEAGISLDCEIVFLPTVELGDVVRITQAEVSPQSDTQLIWDTGQCWDAGWTWGSIDGFLVFKQKMKIVGISIDLSGFTVSLKCIEV